MQAKNRIAFDNAFQAAYTTKMGMSRNEIERGMGRVQRVKGVARFYEFRDFFVIFVLE